MAGLTDTKLLALLPSLHPIKISCIRKYLIYLTTFGMFWDETTVIHELNSILGHLPFGTPRN